MNDEHCERLLAITCTGLVLTRLFGGDLVSVVAGRPSLREALINPLIAREPLSEYGVDSLAWLELITILETQLGLPLNNDFLEHEHISAQILGEAIARSLTLQLETLALRQT